MDFPHVDKENVALEARSAARWICIRQLTLIANRSKAISKIFPAFRVASI
jgi:hypothetical protein